MFAARTANTAGIEPTTITSGMNAIDVCEWGQICDHSGRVSTLDPDIPPIAEHLVWRKFRHTNNGTTPEQDNNLPAPSLRPNR